jgi:hypothetical protein
MTFLSGKEYDGEWKDGKAHGQGVLKFVSGDREVYDGEWKDHNMHRGVVIFMSGAKYEVEWKGEKAQ